MSQSCPSVEFLRLLMGHLGGSQPRVGGMIADEEDSPVS